MLRLTAFVNGVYTDSSRCSTFEKAKGSLVILLSEGSHAGDKVIVSLRTNTRRSSKLIAEGRAGRNAELERDLHRAGGTGT